MRCHVSTDMVFGNFLYMNTNYTHFTVFVTKTEDAGESSTAIHPTEPSALDILQEAARSHTHLPDKKKDNNTM